MASDKTVKMTIMRQPVSLSLLSPQLALIVAQQRDKANNLSGILLTALDEGLKKIYAAAKRNKGTNAEHSVHVTNTSYNIVFTLSVHSEFVESRHFCHIFTLCGIIFQVLHL